MDGFGFGFTIFSLTTVVASYQRQKVWQKKVDIANSNHYVLQAATPVIHAPKNNSILFPIF